MKKYTSLVILFLYTVALICPTSVLAEESISTAADSLTFKPLTAGVLYNNLARKYILGPSDVISVSVVDSPEYEQKEIRVQPDGDIILAPVGVIHVAGMTLAELNDVLKKKYLTLLNNPEITIKLEHTKPFVVYVSGAVLRPGSYELVTDIATNLPSNYDNNYEVQSLRRTPLLSNVIMASGGITWDADLEHVAINNTYDGSHYEVNLLDFVEKADSQQDLYLIPGDTINVPHLPQQVPVSSERFKKFSRSTVFQKNIPVKIYGYVNRPGLISLESSQSGNLNSAIASAGGYMGDSPYAPRKVYISRVSRDGSMHTYTADPEKFDFPLMPNDVIYVPEKARPIVGRVADYTTRLVSPFSTASSSLSNWFILLRLAK